MPAATTAAADAKASSSFDVSTLFGADKAPAQALASQAKNGGPEFIAQIGFADALKKVRSPNTRWRRKARARRGAGFLGPPLSGANVCCWHIHISIRVGC